MNKIFASKLSRYFDNYEVAQKGSEVALDLSLDGGDFLIGFVIHSSDPVNAIAFGDSAFYYRIDRLWKTIKYDSISEVESDPEKSGPPFALDLKTTCGKSHRLSTRFAYGLHSVLIHPAMKASRGRGETSLGHQAER